ncbi:hypothetical protein DRE_06462 [Drechslerella stenobrocha 248]|uniref:Uncharacterized protein n=1 Tax=Drechslerella stenobrocha 248 TaxID=1043628 RepID=W7HNV7_9PEZI|nr:hypothetical protein DRE_06462 [Drechslerella stenobrocha 248]
MPTYTYTPPFVFTATHALGALSLTTLSGLMISSPRLYHKHIIRATNPSTTDLFISTQFTAATQDVLHNSIRSTGALLLGTTVGIFAARNSHPSSFTVLASVSAAVAAAHVVLLQDVLTSRVLRRAWLQETERVVKLGVVVGVNALTAGVSLWAALSFGGWPWAAEGGFFAPVAVHAAAVTGAGEELDLEGVVNVFVKGAVELAGGIGGVVQTLMAASASSSSS